MKNRAILGALALLRLPALAAAGDGPTPLIDKVRSATARYLDLNVALAEGFVPATPCVSGPDTGAMGVHCAWSAHNAAGAVPALDGNLLNYIGAPNRFGLPAFYEIHVWAWQQNPRGSYADWNTRVTCANQPL